MTKGGCHEVTGGYMTQQQLIKNALSLSEIFQSAPLPKGIGFIKEFKRGDAISEMQDGIDCVGVILSGLAAVSSGQNSNVSVAKPGHEFGICNIFVSQPMPTNMRAKVASKVLFIPKAEFARLLASDSDLMFRYVRVCNEKMVYLAEKLQLAGIPSCKGKLAAWLLRHGGEKHIPKDELARQLGISRASLFRALAEFEEMGYISNGQIITVIDGEGLKSHIR